MNATERFLKYIHIETPSDEKSETCPSSECQWNLARELASELRAMGVEDARVDDHGYVYGSIPANREGLAAIGLIAHMDTASCVPTGPMNERVIENYDGGDITLENGDVITVKDTPQLALRKGKRLIVTDGRTLLGADDKAGVAEIMTACERVLAGDAPHGKICIAFTPDEEIGRGADLFDVEGFGADFAYTVDGDEVGGMEMECFNAASLRVLFRGKSVHPGSAKDKLVNACLLAMEYNAMLPAAERPEHTEGYEGFFHLCSMKGETEDAELEYIVRDHDRAIFEYRKAAARHAADRMNARYGEGTVTCVIRDSYYNMAEIVNRNPEILERAEKAYRKCGIEPFRKAIRGGTDGSSLSFKGLPCPNLATGGMNFHGRHECIAADDMETMSEVLYTLLTLED